MASSTVVGLGTIADALRALDAPAGLPARRRPRHSDYDLNQPLAPDRVRLREAAVMVPLVPRPGGLTVLLTERAAHLKHHAGQVSFPGGRIEDCDRSLVAAASRETHEEVGVRADELTPLGLLDDYETVTGFLVTPVVARLDPRFTLAPDPLEVAAVFEVPLAFFLDPVNHCIESRVRNGIRRRFYAFTYGERYVWGATAGMLMNLYRRLNGLSGPMRPPPPAPIASLE